MIIITTVIPEAGLAHLPIHISILQPTVHLGERNIP